MEFSDPSNSGTMSSNVGVEAPVPSNIEPSNPTDAATKT